MFWSTTKINRDALNVVVNKVGAETRSKININSARCGKGGAASSKGEQEGIDVNVEAPKHFEDLQSEPDVAFTYPQVRGVSLQTGSLLCCVPKLWSY